MQPCKILSEMGIRQMASSAEYLQQLIDVNGSGSTNVARFFERTVSDYAQQLRQASLRLLYLSTSSSMDNKINTKSIDALKEEMRQLSARISGLRAYADKKNYEDVMGPQNEARAQLADMIHAGKREDVSRMQKHVQELRSRMDLQDTIIGLEAPSPEVQKLAKGGGPSLVSDSDSDSDSESEVIVTGSESESASELFSDDPTFFDEYSDEDANEDEAAAAENEVKVITITGSAADEMNNVHGDAAIDE
jgi:hypothetical protein